MSDAWRGEHRCEFEGDEGGGRKDDEQLNVHQASSHGTPREARQEKSFPSLRLRAWTRSSTVRAAGSGSISRVPLSQKVLERFEW